MRGSYRLFPTPHQYFDDGGNFMTPQKVRCMFVGPYAVELSRGTGFNRKAIFGVTTRGVKDNDSITDLCGCFSTEREAWDFIDSKIGKETADA